MAKAPKIDHVDVGRLRPFGGNPRKIDPTELKKLQRSIREFGFVEPVVVRRADQLVIGGHQRIEAAKAEGLRKVPVIYIDNIDDDRAAMLNVALNKISGEWDWPKLGDLFGELDTGDLDLTLSGFDLDEIGELMGGLDEKAGSGDLDPDDEMITCSECGHRYKSKAVA